MRKKIIVSIVVFLVLILAGVAIWGFSSGKFAGWADTGPAEIDIFTHDSNNNTVGFVDILVSSDNQNYSSVGQTQSNGHLIYQDLAFQNHTLYLKASKPYHSVSPEYRQLSVSSGNKYNTDFTVTPIAQDLTKGKLKGKVTESGTTNPINGAFIYVSKTSTGFSNDQGNYGIADIAPGTYTVNITRNDYQDAHGTAVITANQETTLNFTLTKKAISPSPSRSSSASPSPSTQPDRNNFIFTAEVVDENTQQLIKDVKVSIKINPGINGAVETTDTTKDSPIDASKYGNNNLLTKVPYPPDCYSYNTKYTVEFSHPAFETQTLPDFYCSDIHFSDNLQTYFYNAHRIALSKKVTFKYLGALSDECVDISSGPGKGGIEGASVTVFDSRYNERSYSAITDSMGDFRVWSIPLDRGATYKVIISHNGYEDANLEFSGNDVLIDESGIDFYFQPQTPYYLNPSGNVSVLEGTVKDIDTGKPIKDAVISLIQNNNITTTFVKTNSQGRYCLKSEPGKFTVFAYHYAYYDNERAVKEIILKKGKNQLDFELKFAPNWKRYDLYLRPVDSSGNPLDIFQNNLYISDHLRRELYNASSDEIATVGDKIYLKFTNVPCGRSIRVSSSEKSRFQTDKIIQIIQFDCLDSNNKYYLDLKLNEVDKSINDPNKPDVYGQVTYNDYCTFGAGVYSDPNIEEIRVVMKQDGRTVYSTVVDPAGHYRFVDVNKGSYLLGTEWSGVDWFERIDVGAEDIKLDHATVIDQSQITNPIINGVNLHFIGPVAQKYAKEIDWNNLTAKYAPIPSSLNDNYKPSPLILPIYVIDVNSRGAFYNYGCAGRLGETSIVLESAYIPQAGDVLGVLFHEYGHHVHLMLKGNDLKIWKNNLKAGLLEEDCVFQAITDSNLNQTFDHTGHPWSNENEYFASFFVAYFQHHERLLALIRSLPEGSDCRNILEFAWQFFSERVAKTPGESIDTASATSANSIRLYANDDKIFGPVVGGKIGNNIYTPDQIAKGLWKQSVYDGLKPTQKAQLKASLAYRRTLNYLKIDPEKYRNQIEINVVKFNSFIDKMLGTKGDRGSIEGIVREQSGGPKTPKENVIVIIGQKMAVTDKDGKFKIENIKIGEQKVRVIDGKTSKNLNVDLETVNIQKDKTIKRYFIVN